jgi:hypothetical protein
MDIFDIFADSNLAATETPHTGDDNDDDDDDNRNDHGDDNNNDDKDDTAPMLDDNVSIPEVHQLKCKNKLKNNMICGIWPHDGGTKTSKRGHEEGYHPRGRDVFLK